MLMVIFCNSYIWKLEQVYAPTLFRFADIGGLAGDTPADVSKGLIYLNSVFHDDSLLFV